MTSDNSVAGVCVALVRIGCLFERRGCGGRGQGRFCDGGYTDVRVCRDGLSPLYAASPGGHVSCVHALIHAKVDMLQCLT